MCGIASRVPPHIPPDIGHMLCDGWSRITWNRSPDSTHSSTAIFSLKDKRESRSLQGSASMHASMVRPRRVLGHGKASAGH